MIKVRLILKVSKSITDNGIKQNFVGINRIERIRKEKTGRKRRMIKDEA